MVAMRSGTARCMRRDHCRSGATRKYALLNVTGVGSSDARDGAYRSSRWWPAVLAIAGISGATSVGTSRSWSLVTRAVRASSHRPRRRRAQYGAHLQVRIERIEASSERRDRLEHRHEHLRLERVRNSASSVIQARENGRRAARRAHLDRAKRRTELLCARYGARAAAAVAATCGGGFERMSCEWRRASSAEAASASRSAASVLSWAPSASNRSAPFQQAEQLPARRSPFRPPPLRGDRTRSGAAERQGAPAAARVDRVLQLVDPSARARSASCCCCKMPRSVVCAARCAAASPRSSKASLLVLLPRLWAPCGCRRRRCCWPPRAAAATAAA